jgi:Ca2+-transporting ATPase
MITGDSIENALYVAKKCEIITEEEANIDGIWLTGEQFRRNYNDVNKFKQIKDRLRVIARATAADKMLLVNLIQAAGGKVAMTGKTIADATALREANVGLCMGTGC